MKISTALSETLFGRIILPLGCLLRRPGHAAWHWHGITRELSAGFALSLGSIKHALTAPAAFLGSVSASAGVVLENAGH